MNRSPKSWLPEKMLNHWQKKKKKEKEYFGGDDEFRYVFEMVEEF